MNAEVIAAAIRAALEELMITASDDQGSFAADVYVDGFEAAEKAALQVILEAQGPDLDSEDYEAIYGWGGQG